MSTLSVLCPYDVAANHELVLSENHELLSDDLPWLRWLRRVSENPRLFAYRHRITGRTVLCVWAWSPSESVKPIAVELVGTQNPPTWLWPFMQSPEAVKDKLKPADERIRERRAAILQKLKDEKHAREIGSLQKKEAVRMLRKKGMETAATNLEIGATPYLPSSMSSDGGASFREFAETRMRKGF